MITIKRYVRAESLEQAYKLNQSRSNRIIGGMLWMKMGDKNIQTAIDVCDLVSNRIEEKETSFVIGAGVTLHQLEMHEGLNQYTHGAMKESLRHIVGVQFRNCATVGGSVYGRFGFSDVLTMLMALDAYVILYKRGVVPLWRFAMLPKDNDILLSVLIKKEPIETVYDSVRNSKTDFPVLTCAMAVVRQEIRVVVGARPQRAVIVPGTLSDHYLEEDAKLTANLLAEQIANQIETGTNMRGSAEYRKHLTKVLARRNYLKLIEHRRQNEC